MKHNNVIPNVHLRKHWQQRVKTFFNQAAKKKTRLINRRQKMAKIFPKPLESLKPVCRGQSVRYNRQLKLGRGFSIDELRACKISNADAKAMKISVDRRRVNRSHEQFEVNVARLKNYLSGLQKFKNREEFKKQNVKVTQKQNKCLKQQKNVQIEQITQAMKQEKTFQRLRQEKANKKWHGLRQKKLEEEQQ